MNYKDKYQSRNVYRKNSGNEPIHKTSQWGHQCVYRQILPWWPVNTSQLALVISLSINS